MTHDGRDLGPPFTPKPSTSETLVPVVLFILDPNEPFKSMTVAPWKVEVSTQ